MERTGWATVTARCLQAGACRRSVPARPERGRHRGKAHQDDVAADLLESQDPRLQQPQEVPLEHAALVRPLVFVPRAARRGVAWVVTPSPRFTWMMRMSRRGPPCLGASRECAGQGFAPPTTAALLDGRSDSRLFED